MYAIRSYYAPGPARRGRRVYSRAIRSRLALADGDLPQARRWARSAAFHARAATGHEPRSLASLALAEASLRGGELPEARRAAENALAFAREQGAPLAAA